MCIVVYPLNTFCIFVSPIHKDPKKRSYKSVGETRKLCLEKLRRKRLSQASFSLYLLIDLFNYIWQLTFSGCIKRAFPSHNNYEKKLSL